MQAKGPPLVACITPSWKRPLQLARCALSVAQQDWPAAQLLHIVVSDLDPDLERTDARQYLAQLEHHYGHRVVFDMLGWHREPGWWGHEARLRGLEIADTEGADLVCWLDDDDVYRRRHVRAHALAHADNPGLGLSISRVWIGSALHNTGRRYWPREKENAIHGGPDYPDPASVHGPQTFMHRAALTREISTWRAEPGPEWQLVRRWLAAGVTWRFVDEVTVEAYQHPDYYEHVYGREVCGTGLADPPEIHPVT